MKDEKLTLTDFEDDYSAWAQNISLAYDSTLSKIADLKNELSVIDKVLVALYSRVSGATIIYQST